MGLVHQLKASGADWDDNEIEIIVADYFDMLQMEQAGIKFNKYEHNRMLQQQLGRTKGSIEYKHQNTSAVLAMLGLPFIWGYKPAVNFQARLFEIIEQQLTGSTLLTHLSESTVATAIPGSGIEFHKPPTKRQYLEDAVPSIHRIFHALDPTVRDARARVLGEAGEKFLFQVEQDRLSSFGRDDLAEKVRWVSKEDGDGAGYDILSYSDLGEPRWLEVKTTNGPSITPFWITGNELRVSEERPEFFRLTRLYNFSWAPAAFRLKPPLCDHVNLVATQFHASF